MRCALVLATQLFVLGRLVLRGSWTRGFTSSSGWTRYKTSVGAMSIDKRTSQRRGGGMNFVALKMRTEDRASQSEEHALAGRSQYAIPGIFETGISVLALFGISAV